MNYILPALILALLLYALAKGVNIYEAFVKGAADALPMLLYILPYMTAMLAGLTVFRQTGALAAKNVLHGGHRARHHAQQPLPP